MIHSSAVASPFSCMKGSRYIRAKDPWGIWPLLLYYARMSHPYMPVSKESWIRRTLGSGEGLWHCRERHDRWDGCIILWHASKNLMFPTRSHWVSQSWLEPTETTYDSWLSARRVAWLQVSMKTVCKTRRHLLLDLLSVVSIGIMPTTVWKTTAARLTTRNQKWSRFEVFGES